MLGRFVWGVKEFFLLEEAERRLAKVVATERGAVVAYYNAALPRLAVADSLRRPSDLPAALSLYREGGWLLVSAYLISRGDGKGSYEHGGVVAFEALEKALEHDHIKAPAALHAAKTVFTASDAVAIDSISRDVEADLKLRTLGEATGWLKRLVDPRSKEQLKVTRMSRAIAATACVALAAVWLVTWILSPKNLALNKVARASSSAFDTAPAGAVDGEKSTRFGYHSQEEDSPWLSIDLGHECDIMEVKVFGRSDCCFDQSVPLAFEVSDDGTSFRKVAERLEPFEEEHPWVFSPGPLLARFVRLRTERRSVLVLGEVEVYGRVKR